jgi:hypothetical protein
VTDTHNALAITLRAGDHTRSVPPESIAAVLHLSPALVRTALAGLLFACLDPRDEVDSLAPGEPTEGVGNDEPNVPNEPKNNGSRNDGTKRDGGEEEGAGEEGEPLDAKTLAFLLADFTHADTFDALVLRHPEALLRRALSITLSRPPGSIRSTPGAYFTGLVAVLARKAAADH